MFKKIFGKKAIEDDKTIAFRGLALLQKGNYQEALTILNEYIERIEKYTRPLDENEGMMYYNRSIAKEALGDKLGAISDLKLSIQLVNLHQAYFKLADLQVKTGAHDEVIPNLVKAYELGSQSAENALRENTNYFDR